VILGLILAGGRSTRFGSEKAVAAHLGRPLIAHVRDALAPCAAVAVSARDDSGAAAWAAVRGLEVLPDPPGAPDGPLSGVREGLRWARRRGAVVLATAPCDTPRLPQDVVPRLAAALHSGTGGAMAETADGLQPLVAVWQVGPALEALERLMRDGAHPPVRDLLAAVGGERVRFDPAWLFDNLNTPEA
jgi:molybdenum cofactor guanylyltransferase